MRAFAASLFVALMLAACSDADGDDVRPTGETATATPTVAGGNPGAISPPSGYLKDETGNAIEGGTGTYCWRQSGAQMCRDYSGPRTNGTPIPIAAGEDVQFVFDAGTPTSVKVDWTPADEMTSSGQGGTLDWGPKDGANYSGPSYTDSITAPAEPGLYVLAAFTLFPEGDVTYGFYVEVQ